MGGKRQGEPESTEAGLMKAIAAMPDDAPCNRASDPVSESDPVPIGYLVFPENDTSCEPGLTTVGLLGYLLSLPEGTHLDRGILMRTLPHNADFITRQINILADLGYLVVGRKGSETRWAVCDTLNGYAEICERLAEEGYGQVTERNESDVYRLLKRMAGHTGKVPCDGDGPDGNVQTDRDENLPGPEPFGENGYEGLDERQIAIRRALEAIEKQESESGEFDTAEEPAIPDRAPDRGDTEPNLFPEYGDEGVPITACYLGMIRNQVNPGNRTLAETIDAAMPAFGRLLASGLTAPDIEHAWYSEQTACLRRHIEPTCYPDVGAWLEKMAASGAGAIAGSKPDSETGSGCTEKIATVPDTGYAAPIDSDPEPQAAENGYEDVFDKGIAQLTGDGYGPSAIALMLSRSRKDTVPVPDREIPAAGEDDGTKMKTPDSFCAEGRPDQEAATENAAQTETATESATATAAETETAANPAMETETVAETATGYRAPAGDRVPAATEGEPRGCLAEKYSGLFAMPARHL